MYRALCSARSAYKYRAAVTCKKMWLCSVLEGCVGAHLPDVEFGFESMRRVDVQSKGAIIDGRPDRSGCRTAPPAPPAATRETRLRGPKWPSFGACSLSHLQSSIQERRKTAGSPPKPPWIHREGPSAWCGAGGAAVGSPRRLRVSLTSNHARSRCKFGHIVTKLVTYPCNRGRP